MATVTIPAGPLQDAAASIGAALQAALSQPVGEQIPALLRDALTDIFAAAKEVGILTRDLDRAKRQNDRVLAANLALSKRLMQEQGTSEDLVRDLAPALEEITVVFQRAIQRQLALRSIHAEKIPAPDIEHSTAAAVDIIRHSPIEAYGALT